MAEKISPLIALLERRNLELAELKERIVAQPDIVYRRECKKRYTRYAQWCQKGSSRRSFVPMGEGGSGEMNEIEKASEVLTSEEKTIEFLEYLVRVTGFIEKRWTISLLHKEFYC